MATCCGSQVNGVAPGGGGGGETWAQTLALGNVSGGTFPTLSIGDEIQSANTFTLRALGDGWHAIIRAANGSSSALGQTRDVELFGGTATAGNTQGGRVLLWGGSGSGTQPGGPIRANAGTGGSTSGLGGAVWFVGGQGGTPNGDGGDILLEGGQGVGFGNGGIGECRAGNGYSGGNALLKAGNGASNHAGSCTVQCGTAAGNGNGGNTYLVPTAQSGAGTVGTAWVGNQTIVTMVTNLGAGAQIFTSKASGTINGAAAQLRSILAGSGIAVAQNANDIAISQVFSDGSEFGFQDSVAGDVTVTQRRTVVRGRQVISLLYYVNIAAGSRTLDLRARSVTAGQTTTIRNRQIWGQNNLGNDFYSNSAVTFTTTSNSFVDVTNSSGITIGAGIWVISASLEVEPP